MIDLDVVVVGHRPGPETRRMLDDAVELAGTEAKLLYFDNTGNPKNLSEAWNDLAASGDAPCVAFLNSDAIPSPGWGAYLFRVLKEHPGVGAVLPVPVLPPQADFLGRSFGLHDPPTRQDLEAMAAWSAETGAGKPIPLQARHKVGFFSVAMRRDDFRHLHGFDERFRFYGQDHDMQERLLLLGKSTVVALACPFYPGNGVSTRRAISFRDINIEAEYHHCDVTTSRVRSGDVPVWHMLTDQERAAVKADPESRISRGSRVGRP